MRGFLTGSKVMILVALGLMGGVAVSADDIGRSGKTFKECGMCPEMVVIPPGTFIMGSPETETYREEDEGRHRITIAYAFAVSKAPITWDQWEACARDGMCDGQAVETALRASEEGRAVLDHVGPDRGNHPVIGNIYQWIEDCYESDGALLPTDGSAVESGNCTIRGFRGNSFMSDPKSLRSANRAFVYPPDTKGRGYLGFRVAKELDEKPGEK